MVKQLCIYSLVLYEISLYIFVDSAKYIKISQTLFILFAVLACLDILHRKKLYLNKIMIPLLGFLLFSLLSYFWAIDTNVVVNRVIKLTQLIILLFLVSQVLNTTKNIDDAITGIAIAGITLFIFGILVYGLKNIYMAILTGERLGLEISQENTMGRLAALSVVVLFAHGIEKRKYSYFLLMCLPFVMVLASGSRTSITILLLGLLVTIFLKFGFKKIYKLLIIVPILLLVFYYLSQLSIFDAIKLRFDDLYIAVNGGTADGALRINMIRWGIEWFLKSPFWGYGIGNYGDLLFGRIAWMTYAHNNFIELLVGVGIIGFSLYYFSYVYILYNLYKIAHDKIHNANILFTIFTVWLVAEMGSVNYTSKMTYVLIGICFAFIWLYKRELNARIPKEIKIKKITYFK